MTTIETDGPPEFRERTRRFVALRAAQRALSSLVHPTELKHSLDHGGQVWEELQALRSESAQGHPLEERSLAKVDALLDEVASRARWLLETKRLAELRPHLTRVAAEDRDAIRGLAEVALGGNLRSDETLRVLEYLLTLLCCDLEDGRKTVSRSPQEALPALEDVASRHVYRGDPSCRTAEQMLSSATTRLLGGDDPGVLRDEMRERKRELGVRILHPAVLSAAVAYNAAMWNCLEQLAAGNRGLDALAEELLETPASGRSVLDSAGLLRLQQALAARVAGAPIEDAAAARVVEGWNLADLDPADLESFDGEGREGLDRMAVTLGFALRAGGEQAQELQELGVDLEQSGEAWAAELWRELAAAARKLLASGDDTEARRLTELRGRNLPRPAPKVEAGRGASPAAAGLPFHSSLFRHSLAMVLFGIGALLLGVLVWPDRAVTVYGGDDLPRISRYLESGYRTRDDGVPRFVGSLGADWSALGLSERRRVVEEMGTQLAERGLISVILVDAQRQIQARYRNGAVLWVAEPVARGD